ncbi:glycosyltransferase involved in cell wall biosynthesis [Wenyingzhuangia heitensis]|uniref:Glycosyltransferase involved in cell wall biosynthesis n=1 Tax=Wenyingzhuangia heitensis TaxID=1487859 RepID=A0ABX0UBA8_9FLAO|nr:glycosyltransferase family 2 protein [Wenyingzhuangia heitensis]NIJ46013.1 glycosyltransferase involved in cell wall biosynthesis [Wenyingzhuangia heitensis]
MSKTSLLSIVVPVYNEEGNVTLLTDNIDKGLEGYNYEIIYIDDCSTDNTRKEVKELNHPKVILVELRKNYGQSSAIAAGIDIAKGEYIITMDGDLQNDPSDLPAMLDKLIEEDLDMITGIRQKRKDNFVRTLPSKIANFIIRKTTGLHITDHGCAIKIFTAETAKGLKLYGEMHRFISLVTFMNGARISEMPVKHHARQFGVSKYGLGRTFKVINDLLLILFQRKYMQKPIYLFGNIGLVFAGAGMLINFYLLIIKLMGEDIWGRPLLILGVMLVVMGIQFFTVGIIIDLLMKTYYESQDKRPYNLRKVTTFEKK